MKVFTKHSISALVIARNEQASVEKVIKESIDILPKLSKKYEILINDDASSDKTSAILDKFSKKYNFIKVFHQKKPLGISGGLEFLYKKSNNQLVFTNAADGQFTIKDLPKMIDQIHKGYDLVVGKRSSKKHYSTFRKVISYFYNKLPKILFGVELFDAGSNKLYKKNVLEKTRPISKSVFSEAERIIRAYKLGFNVSYVNIHHFARKKETSSTIRLKTILHSLLDVLKYFYITRRKSLFIISVLFILIIIGQVLSVRPVLNRALNGDDWDSLTVYRADPYASSYVERAAHIYTTSSRAYISQFIYIGTLYDIFGFNPQTYQLVSIFFKVVATLSIYFLIIILLKNRLLAFISAFLFSIWPSAAGGLTFITTGQHYLAIIFIALFVGSYHYLIKNQFQNKKTNFSSLLINSLFFYLALISAPERTFPFLAIPFLVESILFLKIIFRRNLDFLSKKKYGISFLKRLLFIYGIIYIFFFKKTNVTDSPDFYQSVIYFYDRIFKESNWQILLIPFTALGNTLIDNKLLSSIYNTSGSSQIESLKILLQKHIIFSAIFTLIISWLIKSKNFFLFYSSIVIATLISALLIISIVKNVDSIPFNLRVYYDLNSLNAVFIASYYFILSVAFFTEWLLNQRNSRLLLTLSLCPWWSLLFIVSTWLTKIDTNTISIHRYLTIPSISSVIFVSIIIVLFYKRLTKMIKYNSATIRYLILIILLIPIFYYQTSYVFGWFNKDNETTGRLNSQQTILKQRLDEQLDKNRTKNMLVYIEWQGNPADYTFGLSFFDAIQDILLYDNNYNLIEGCKGFTYADISKLKKITRINKGVVTFLQQSYCINQSIRSDQMTEFKLEEFQAFLLKNDQFFDIKEETLSKLKP